MPLVEYDLFGDKHDKVAKAIERLKAFEPPEGYYVAFSGGKDSQAVYHLCEMAGVKFDAHYNITSVDPPELVRFIKTNYPDVALDFPRDQDGKVITMWNLIPRKKMPPTRLVRYCCEKFKETSGKGRITVTGVRWEESCSRKANQALVNVRGKKPMKIAEAEGVAFDTNKSNSILLNYDDSHARRIVEQCYRTNKTLVNPIIDWLAADVWEFLRDVAKVKSCILYKQGYKRLGCIGCPLSSNQYRELAAYPTYKKAYIRAFERMLEQRREAGLPTEWTTADEVMRWWIGGKT